MIFESDWPHIEGMPQPLDHAVEVKKFDLAAPGLVLYDNAVELTTLARR